jgi:hypothetical protein
MSPQSLGAAPMTHGTFKPFVKDATDARELGMEAEGRLGAEITVSDKSSSDRGVREVRVACYFPEAVASSIQLTDNLVSP